MSVQKVLIFCNKRKSGAEEVAARVVGYLKERKARIAHFHYNPLTHETADEDRWIPQVDFAVCIGGDGTALHLCRALMGRRIPIVTINYGQLGFITEFAADDWREALERMFTKNYELEERIFLDVQIIGQRKVRSQMNALNDAVLSVAGISKLTHYSVYIGDQFLASYRADGLIIATPTGSTAYSVAAGGPILHPALTTLVVNPICPFTLAHRPLVIPITEEVRVVPHYTGGTQVVLTVDGQETRRLEESQQIRIRTADDRVLIVRSENYSFYEAIRQKLKWAMATDAE